MVARFAENGRLSILIPPSKKEDGLFGQGENSSSFVVLSLIFPFVLFQVSCIKDGLMRYELRGKLLLSQRKGLVHMYRLLLSHSNFTYHSQ